MFKWLKNLKNLAKTKITQVREWSKSKIGETNLTSNLKEWSKGRITQSSMRRSLTDSPFKNRIKAKIKYPKLWATFKAYEKRDFKVKKTIQTPVKDEVPYRVSVLARLDEKFKAISRLEQTKIEYTRTNMSNPYKTNKELNEYLRLWRTRTVLNYNDDDLEEFEFEVDKQLRKLGFTTNNYKGAYNLIEKSQLSTRNITEMAARQAYEHYLNQWEKNFYDSDVEDPYGDGLMTDEMKAIIFEDIRANISFEKYVTQKRLFKKIIQKSGKKIWMDPVSNEWFEAKRSDLTNPVKVARKRVNRAYRSSMKRSKMVGKNDYRYYDPKTKNIRTPNQTYYHKLISAYHREMVKRNPHYYRDYGWKNTPKFTKLVERAKKHIPFRKLFK
ncbi:MAG: hypothetical protein E7Y34_01830 [Mycoplasma sp.]|nr:hypothetical protein [Mycoplasma sp.]